MGDGSCGAGNRLRVTQIFTPDRPQIGVPLVYELDADLKPMSHAYLGDPDAIARAAAAVAHQGKA